MRQVHGDLICLDVCWPDLFHAKAGRAPAFRFGGHIARASHPSFKPDDLSTYVNESNEFANSRFCVDSVHSPPLSATLHLSSKRAAFLHSPTLALPGGRAQRSHQI